MSEAGGQTADGGRSSDIGGRKSEIGNRNAEREREDLEFMRRVQADDEGALGALMERWELPVKTLIARIVLNARDAEELAQETFGRVWQQRKKFRSDAPFRPWVFAIAINLARNRLRWWRKRPEISLQEWSEPGVEDSGARSQGSAFGAPLSEPGSETATAALERVERATAVREAIAALPRELREAVVLFEYEELSHAEIAATLGCTAKAVESRLYRARAQLRASLKRWL